jgi:membrane associated rhomboid family serine protease
MTKQELLYKYKTLNIAEKLIAINIVVFILFGLGTFLFRSSFLYDWFVLSKDVSTFILKPWSILSYSFIHQGFFHLLMNMLMLFYVSRFFLNLYSAKMFLNIYLLGALVGGGVFLLSYNLFPVFQNQASFLVGASASVMAVLIFIATTMPNIEVSIFTFRIKLWHIGLFFVVKDLIQIPLGNSGGHLAHLGGSLLGYFYANQLNKGNDIGKGFEMFLDKIVSYFNSRKKTNLKTVHKTKAQHRYSDSPVHKKKNIKQEQIDAILDKISKSGYESLSKAEKSFLFQSGKD